jgi:hypothetical protein
MVQNNKYKKRNRDSILELNRRYAWANLYDISYELEKALYKKNGDECNSILKQYEHKHRNYLKNELKLPMSYTRTRDLLQMYSASILSGNKHAILQMKTCCDKRYKI